MRDKDRHAPRWFTIIALSLCATCAAVITPLATPAVAQTEPSNETDECWGWDDSELPFFGKINEVREAHGVDPVTIDPELSRVSHQHSFEMEAQQRLYHTPGFRLHRRVTNSETLGETVGRGATPDSLFQAFMQSRAHRHVILSKEFKYVGVAFSYDSGRIWATMVFQAFDDPGTTMNMNEC